MLGQTSTVKPQTTAPQHKTSTVTKSGVDTVIELVKGGLSETLMIKQLQRAGKAYELSTPDLLKLQKAGVSENIINVMMDPKTNIVAQADPPANVGGSSSAQEPIPGGPSPGPEALQPAVEPAVAATPYPADLPNIPPVRKRRVVVAVFNNAAIKDTVQNYYQAYYRALGLLPNQSDQNTNDVGQGIRAMLMSRLQQSNIVTVLERNTAIDRELTDSPSAQREPGHQPQLGHVLGSDCVVTGDITVFGWDNTVKTKGGGLGGLIPKAGALGALQLRNKEDKAVVAMEFRIVDTETSAVILTANARGESVRKGKSLGIEGLGGGTSGVGGGFFQNAMTSSGFEKTILGEATVDAIDKIVKQLEEKIPQLPAKPRNIEGRVAATTDGGVYLALSSNDGVLQGDRFEVRQINNEVFDPRTKEPIAVEAVKVGEIVIKEVDNKSAFGDYGGQPLSADHINGKGYQVRLISK
jgi:curli biogenesis system outer membrane secretion channel CsgG